MGAATPIDPAEEPLRHHAEGDVVALREVWRGRVWEARPAVVVRDDPNVTMLYVAPHATCRVPVDAKGRELRLPLQDWRLADVERGDTRILSFAFPDTPYAVILPYHDEGGRSRYSLSQYYVNLQTPLRRAATGFDIVEHVLDVTIPVDRSSWSWKDEDELDQAIAHGLFTEEDAAWFRYWGERAVEHVLLREPPFDQDWTDWRPDPAWDAPALPEGWDAVPAV